MNTKREMKTLSVQIISMEVLFIKLYKHFLFIIMEPPIEVYNSSGNAKWTQMD